MYKTNLHAVQQDMIRYGTTIYLVLGLVGNVCNCIMFTRPLQRRTASSVYFLCLSIVAIVYLVWSVAPLLRTLDHTDPQVQSVFYCKMRLYISHALGQCLRYIIVFACADRFFVTHTNVRVRSLNSTSTAIRSVCIIAPVCFLATIHIPIYLDIRDGVCGMVGLYKLIYAVYQITLAGILPPALMVLFSILTIRRIRQLNSLHRRVKRTDRYVLRMVLAEVLVNIVTSIPYSINLVYGAVTYNTIKKSAQRVELESFITFASQFLIYLISVAPFYLFLLTSKSFRKGFIDILLKCCNRCLTRPPRIAPVIVRNNIPAINRTVTYGKHQRIDSKQPMN